MLTYDPRTHETESSSTYVRRIARKIIKKGPPLSAKLLLLHPPQHVHVREAFSPVQPGLLLLFSCTSVFSSVCRGSAAGQLRVLDVPMVRHAFSVRGTTYGARSGGTVCAQEL